MEKKVKSSRFFLCYFPFFFFFFFIKRFILNRNSFPSSHATLRAKKKAIKRSFDKKNNVRYIKEGSTVSVMGVVRRHDNVLMITPPAEPVSTGCQWARCLLPSYVEGLVLMCDDSQNADVVPV